MNKSSMNKSPMNKSLVNKCFTYALLTAISLVSACSPTVEVKAPQEPITINMNIKIEHEVRIKVDKALDDVFSEDSDLF